PSHYKNCNGRPACRAILSDRRQRSMLSHDFSRDQFDDKRNAERDEDQIVHIANDRDEIRNQINWRGRVSGDSNGKRLCIPRHTGITGGKIKCVSIAPYGAHSFLPTINHSIVFLVRLGLTNVRFTPKSGHRNSPDRQVDFQNRCGSDASPKLFFTAALPPLRSRVFLTWRVHSGPATPALGENLLVLLLASIIFLV